MRNKFLGTGEPLVANRSPAPAFVRQSGQESLELGATQVGGMAPTVKADARSHPIDINPLDEYAVTHVPGAPTQLVEDLDRVEKAAEARPSSSRFFIAVRSLSFFPAKRDSKAHSRASGVPCYGAAPMLCISDSARKQG
jgi:hypothetical protein